MSKVSFEPLKIRRLSEVIENSIRDLILTGEIKVGSRLPTETEISRQFGVSIVTVREALRGLEVFGIIKRKRGKNGGIFVSQIESKIVKSAIHNFLIFKRFSAKDLGDIRLIVEPSVVALAALNITPEEIKAIEKNIMYCNNKMEKKKHSFSAKDFFDIEELNVEFHRLLAEATHNPLLILIVDYIMDFLISFKKVTLAPDISFSNDTVKDHFDILEDVKKGDTRSARRRMVRHLRLVEKYLTSKEPHEETSTNNIK